MGRIRRKNYIFVSQLADHPPRHVHIYSDDRLVAKWDLENKCVMLGAVDKKLRKVIEELVNEGQL